MTFSIPHSGNIARVVLPNGIVVLAMHNPAVRSVNLTGSLPIGEIHNTSGVRGVAAMTGALLLRGTQAHDFDALHTLLEDAGADLGIGATHFRTSFGGKALAEDLPLLLNLLAEALRTPSLPQVHLDLLRQQRLTEWTYAQQDTRYRARRAFAEALYPPTHPFHYTTTGTPDDLKALTTDHLRAFHAQFRPQGICLVIVGNIDPQDALAQVQATLGDWHATPVPVTVTIETLATPQAAVQVHTPIVGKTQSDLVLGTLAPSRFSPDYIAASLANSVLGEFGMMGRLGAIIRDELGLAYSASSGLEASEAQGAWTVSAGVAPQNVDLAIARATDEVRRLTQEKISPQDLADNQAYYTGRQPLRLETSGGIAASIEGMERFGLGLDYLLHYRDMIYAITTDDILRVAQSYLNPDALVTSVAGSDHRQE